MTDDVAAMILLVGSDAALLEGLAQSFAARAYTTSVAASLQQAKEFAAARVPLVAVIERELAVAAPSKALSIPLAPGGAFVLFHAKSDDSEMLPPALQRVLLADLALPLERQRLMALVQHVELRARATGRSERHTPRPPEQRAP
jgi:DNA-binding NtrC family response regulator